MSAELDRQMRINNVVTKIKTTYAGLDMATRVVGREFGRSLAEYERTPRFLATVLVDNDWTWAEVLRVES